MVQDSSDADLLKKGTTDLLRDALELGDRPVTAGVTPRADVVFATPDTSPEQLEGLAIRTGFSRFPVIESDDTVSGYLHLKDVLYAGESERDLPVPVKRVRKLATVQPEDEVEEVLATMQRTGAHLARVVDGEGQDMGVVFLEDVLEELVGEVTDASQR